MKRILLLLLVCINLMYAEVAFYGAYYGDIKEKITNFNNYPEHGVSSAGKVYLYKNKINSVDYIYNTKVEHINEAIKRAKEFAKEKKYKYYAVDNIHHQIIIDDNTITVMTDYNVLAF
tara:strand:- start:1200 stop:1553 length:354 start_codon:yes stop_codon:yes gene_type:complete